MDKQALSSERRSRKIRLTALSLLTVLAACNSQPERQGFIAKPVTILPAVSSKKCDGKSLVLYDPCRDQIALFKEAQQLAKSQNKALLVSFGADWCIWCHVFDAYVRGEHGQFTHPTDDGPWSMAERHSSDARGMAERLNALVAKRFVLLHVDASDRTNGFDVLDATGAIRHYNENLPFIFSVDENDRYVGHLVDKDISVRRDGWDPFRGYERQKLIDALERISPEVDQIAHQGSEKKDRTELIVN